MSEELGPLNVRKGLNEFYRLIGFVCLFAVSSGVASIQESDETNYVALGMTSGLSGDEGEMPLSLKLLPGARVGRLELEVTWLGTLLTFAQAKPAARLQDVQGRVEVEEPAESWGSVRIRVEAGGGELREGTLAYLYFQILPAAQGQSPILIQLQAKAFSPEAAEREVAVESYDGTVTVGRRPDVVFSCFFYMH